LIKTIILFILADGKMGFVQGESNRGELWKFGFFRRNVTFGPERSPGISGVTSPRDAFDFGLCATHRYQAFGGRAGRIRIGLNESGFLVGSGGLSCFGG